MPQCTLFPHYCFVSVLYIFSPVAVVGLEKTVQEASEEDGVVEVCVRVLSPDIECPIQFPFSVILSFKDGSAGA